MEDKKYLVIDIGGTYIKYGMMNRNLELTGQGKKPTPKDSLDSLLTVLDSIYELEKDQVCGVAFSMPGRIDGQKGIAYTGGHLRYIENLELVKLLEARWNTSVTIENDAKCAALAEAFEGSLKGCKSGLVIVIGTGLGGGVILDGKLYRGNSLSSGEISCMLMDYTHAPDDRLDVTWAAYGGVYGLLRPYAEALGEDLAAVDGVRFFEALKSKDETAERIFDQYLNVLAAGIFSVQALLDVERIAIGGGISAQDILIDGLRTKVGQYINEKSYLPVVLPEVVRCRFGNDANLIGALKNFIEQKDCK